jgi:hypothetical protein
LQFPLAAFRRDTFHELDRVVRFQHLGFQFPHPTVQPKHRRLPYDNVNIASPLLDGSLK